MSARRPDLVEDLASGDRGVEVSAGFDTDADGRSDTVVLTDGVDLALHTDLDGDGYADQVVRVSMDGVIGVCRRSGELPLGDPPEEWAGC